MRRTFLIVACAIGLIIGVAAQAQAYLIFQGVFDETIKSTTTPALENTDCYKIAASPASFACETKRTSTEHAGQRVFQDRVYTRKQVSGKNVDLLDNTWVCYNRGRPVGSVNVIYSCFNPVPAF